MKKLLLCCCVVFAYADFRSYFDTLNKDTKNIVQLKNLFFADDLNDKLNLQAIFNDKAKINEQWYQKDDSINGARIIEISNQGFVLLEKDNHQFHLNIKRVNHKIHIR